VIDLGCCLEEIKLREIPKTDVSYFIHNPPASLDEIDIFEIVIACKITKAEQEQEQNRRK
jgi:hypothetical protein